MATLTDLVTSKIPPQDLACERALIGAVLCGMDPLPPLLAEEFYQEAHRRIWGACQAVDALDGRCTLPTVCAYLAQHGQLEEVGGPAHLARCVEEGCAVWPLTGLARTIRDRARSRAVILLGADLVRDGYAPGDPVAEAELQRRLSALPGPLAQAIWDPPDAWAQIRARWGQDGMRTGWGALDDLAGGLWPGELIIVAGRTSHGKTSFSAAAGVRMAQSEGLSVDMITLEDPVPAMTRRLIATLTGLSYRRLRTGDLSPAEAQRADAAVAQLAALPICVTGIDRHGQASEDGVLGLLAQAKGRVVMIDHLQRIWTKDQSRAYGLERVLARIHSHVQRTGQIAWVNCQLNRQVEGRKDGKPQLSDLRDSGAIEILARQVWIVSWPHKWDEKRDWRDYHVEVAKNSEGQTGPVELRWDPKSGRFWTADEGPPEDLAGNVPSWVTRDS